VTKIGVEIKRYPAIFEHLKQWKDGCCPKSVISVPRAAAAGRSSDRWLQ
jgi:hypothetical protein